MIYLGAKKDSDEEPVRFRFNSDDLAETMPAVLDLAGNVVREEWEYWPKVDVTITASDDVVKGKQKTLEALQVLSQAQITPENWKLFAAQLEILDIPNKQEIIDEWKQSFEGLPQTGGAVMGGSPKTSAMPELPLDVPMGI